MRTKFLSILASFLVLSVVMSSCLDTEETTSEYSTDATLFAFGLDTIVGSRHYQFTINQLTREIYNVDSMPMAVVDTLQKKKVLIDTLSCNAYVMTLGLTKDTVLSTTDSVDLYRAINAFDQGKGVEMRVFAADGHTHKDYKLEIRVHKTDPDSLYWTKMDGDQLYSSEINKGKQRAIIAGDNLMIFTEGGTVYSADVMTNSGSANFHLDWSRQTMTVADGQALDVTSVIYFKEMFWMIDANTASSTHAVYNSADGYSWSKVESLGNDVISLIAVVDKGEKLSCIVADEEGNQQFNKTDGATWSTTAYDFLNPVTTDFPDSHIYAAYTTTSTDQEKVVILGYCKGDETEERDYKTPWFTMNGSTGWADLYPNNAYDVKCPNWTYPTLIHYNGLYYATGDAMECFYSSVNGIAWYEVTSKFMPPYKDNIKKNFSIAVDANNRIWWVRGGMGDANELQHGIMHKFVKK